MRDQYAWGRAPTLVRRNPANWMWGWRCRLCHQFTTTYESQPEALHGARLHLDWNHA